MSVISWLLELCYTFHSDIFLLALTFQIKYQTQKNVIKDLPPNRVIEALEVYKKTDALHH